jgi:sugar phosphate isomerase/epimerase
MDTVSRREFVRKTGMAAASLAAAPALSGNPLNLLRGEGNSWRVHFFSKHLQFLDYHGAAEACAMAGMSGADLTVRPGGHVLPENVERDLPLAVKAFRDVGLTIEMMCSGITDPEDPLTEKVLGTASELGIKYYRLGYYKYDPALSVVNNLEKFRVQMNGLARLNEKYKIHGAYQNHAGSNFGAPVWDVWTVIKDMDPQWTGCQYDVRHATVEGNRSWPLGMKLLKDHIRCMVSKDFEWGEKDGRAIEVNVPIGEGIVDFETYFGMVKEMNIHGPITMHLEYEMFPEKDMTLAEQKAHAIQLMRKDLDALKKYL